MIKLHLGCGKRDFGSDWEHVDAANFPHIKWHDVTKLRHEDNSVDLIYASHLIAYFDREEIIDVLKEWKRVLKPGGVLRLATPDATVLFDYYIASFGAGLDDILGPLYGKMIINSMTTIYHKTVYNLNDLKLLLIAAGFNKVRMYDHTKTDHPNTGNRSDRFDDCSAAYINGQLISLNVECNKP